MSFLEYLKDKRYFILFYLCVMLLVTIILFVSIDQQQLDSDLAYIHLVCGFLAAAYLIIGYYYRNSFFRKLTHLTENKTGHAAIALPEPQNMEQALYIKLLNKIYAEHTLQLQKLNNGKREHQEFIMAWIHEVKLPIASSRLLMEHGLGMPMDDLVDKLEDDLNKIDHYVEQALYYSRIDSFAKDYFITEISLNQTLKESVKKYAKLFIHKRIRFSMFDGQHFVQSDSKWLGYIADQIIANALTYTRDGGEIKVSFEEDKLEKRIDILDSGIGVKPEDLARVFDKGFTGSTGRSHAKSTGMGLYLAQQLSLKLGHRLSIQSEEGTFTLVSIHFPKNLSYMQLDR